MAKKKTKKRKKNKENVEIKQDVIKWNISVGTLNKFLALVSCKGLVNDVVLKFEPKKVIASGVSIHGVVIFEVIYENDGISGSGEIAIPDIGKFQKVLSRFGGDVLIFTDDYEILHIKQSGKSATLNLASSGDIESNRASDSVKFSGLKLDTPRGTWDFSKGLELELPTEWLKTLVGDASVFEDRSFRFYSKEDLLEVIIGVNVEQFRDNIELEGLSEGDVDAYYEFGLQETLSSLEGDNVQFFILNKQGALIKTDVDENLSYTYIICEAEREDENEEE